MTRTMARVSWLVCSTSRSPQRSLNAYSLTAPPPAISSSSTSQQLTSLRLSSGRSPQRDEDRHDEAGCLGARPGAHGRSTRPSVHEGRLHHDGLEPLDG